MENKAEVERLFETAPAEAEQVLLKFVENNSNDAQAYMMLGVTRMKLLRYPGAVAAFRDALRIQPHDKETLVLLATALYVANDMPNALTAWQNVAKADPNSTDAYTKIALIADVTGHTELALDARRELVKLQPDDPLVIDDLAVSLSRANKHDEAVRMFERLKAVAPDFLEKNPVEASAYEASKKAIEGEV